MNFRKDQWTPTFLCALCLFATNPVISLFRVFRGHPPRASYACIYRGCLLAGKAVTIFVKKRV